MKLTTALAVATASISTMVYAQTERDLDSHEHGSASLNVALDADSVFIELDTPWNNIIGFEHAPRTPEQHALVDDALALINQPAKLFSFDGTDCTVTETMLENNLATSESDEHHDDEHKDEHKDEHHDDDHKDEHHDDDHKDEHNDDDHKGEAESHSSMLVSYSFTCSSIEKLEAIDVDLITRWSGFEDLDVQLIGPGGQASIELSPQQFRLDVTQVK